MKKAVKGNFGYLASKRCIAIIRTVVFFGISLAVFAAGYITTGKRDNLLTVAAVLICLPACKSMVNMIMLIRAHGCSDKARKTLAPLEGRLIGMYDMYFTSYQKNFAISHMIVEGKIILGYTESAKCDTRACQEHLQTMLRQGGWKDRVVKISDDLGTYAGWLKSLNEKNQENDPCRDDEIRVLLYDISL